MRKTAYLVSVGAYADYSVLAVFETEPDAEAYAARWNVTRRDRPTASMAEVDTIDYYPDGDSGEEEWR